VYGPGCNDGAGKAFSRPTDIAGIPGNGNQLLSNIRAEDVAAAVEYLSNRKGAYQKAFNLAEDSNPTLEEALTLAARTFGQKTPALHLPLSVVKTVARIDGFVSGLKGKIPDLEMDAVKYLYDDYVVDNSRLITTGYNFIYPNFTESMKQIGTFYKANTMD
jgi:UDP-glucose 4-epimerase